MLRRVARIVRPVTTIIRPIKETELTLFDEWASKYGHEDQQRLGTNRTLLEASYTYDPKGFLVAVDVQDKPVGLVAACNMDDKTAFVGRRIVRPDLLGMGIGEMLMDASAEHVGGTTRRAIHINVSPDTVRTYIRRGVGNKLFEFGFYTGIPKLQVQTSSFNTTQIDVVSYEHFRAILNYDKDVYVIKRDRFLSRMFTGEDVTSVVATEGSNVVGYGCSYEIGQKSYIVGPLYADNICIATKLLNNLFSGIEPKSMVSLAVPLAQNGIEQLLESCGFCCTMRLVRLCSGTDPPLRYNKAFVATTVLMSLI